MTKATILLADNDPDFLRTRSEFLEQHGYQIIPALEPVAAKRIIEQGEVDLAILDLRLINDDDEKDLSGLSVAKESVPSIPKIILTRFPTIESVREALGPALDGLPPAVDFLAKQEGPQALLAAIRKILRIESRRFEEILDAIILGLQERYDNSQQQTRVNLRIGLGVLVAGIVIIFVGIGLALSELPAVGTLGVAAGIVIEALSFLFFRQANAANARVDALHGDILRFRQFEALLAALTGNEDSLSLESGEKYWRQLREMVIQAIQQQSASHDDPSA